MSGLRHGGSAGKRQGRAAVGVGESLDYGLHEVRVDPAVAGLFGGSRCRALVACLVLAFGLGALALDALGV
jgi:hypothetical protein